MPGWARQSRDTSASRSIYADSDDVLITHGAAALLRALGARIIEVPVDADGIDVSAIPRRPGWST
jgi:DNA-binding transcriptional MocR family regulator